MSAKRRWTHFAAFVGKCRNPEVYRLTWALITGDRFLVTLVLIGAVLSLRVPFAPQLWVAAVDWRTIVTLCGLLSLTKGVELSGYFDVLGRRLARRFSHQRALALFLAGAAALLSTFLTNDVALFIMVPLSLTLKRWCAIPVNRLIIFQALAVNAGSLLTPVGNPQNILLWGRSGLSFGDFVGQMLPLALLALVTLLGVGYCAFSNRPLHFTEDNEPVAWQPGLLLICALLYGLFIVALNGHVAGWGLGAVMLVFALRARAVLRQTDWRLLLIFIVMFIDVHLITQLPPIARLMEQAQSLNLAARLTLGAGVSQIISNVPATILLLHYQNADRLLVWSVNIGGFGLATGSLANLIALRMAGNRRIWITFHLWSLPVLLWCLVAGYILLLIFR